MQLNDLVSGTPQPFLKFMSGMLVGESIAEGAQTLLYPRGTVARKWKVQVLLLKQDAASIGGAASNTQLANEYRARQFEELCGNYYLQPLYIQWFIGGSVTPQTKPQDGWYLIENCSMDYTNTVFGIITMDISVAFLYAGGAPPSRPLAVWWAGGTRSTNFSGASTPWLSFPLGSAAISGVSTTTRVGAEGAIPFTSGFFRPDMTAPINPFWISLTSNIPNWYKGGTRIYDTVNTGSNPVPNSGSTFVNANWIEVKGSDHLFLGDAAITNGLLLLLFQNGTTPGITLYCWDTTGTANWRQMGTISYFGSDQIQASLRALNFIRLGLEDMYIKVIESNARFARFWIKLVRGAYAAYIDFQPLSEANTIGNGLLFTPTTAYKAVYNDIALFDQALLTANQNLTPSATYGYGAGIATSIPVISGLLWQKQPSAGQPFLSSTTAIGMGDTTVPLQNNIQSYAAFAFPFSASIANLQSEGESGALGTGWSSVADANASGGNAAKAASGTLVSNADLFGTAWQPPVFTYDIWFRVRVTSAAGSASEMTLGWWDTTSSAFIASASTTYKANQAVTAYAGGQLGWLRVATNITPPAGHNVQFRAVTAATLGTDWFIDEAIAVPRTGTITNGLPNGPQDLWQQFMWDRTVRIAPS